MFQVIFPASESNEYEINEFFKTDSDALMAIGIMVGTMPSDIATLLMYRGFTIFTEEKYPNDQRFINTYKECKSYMDLSKYYEHIADLTIETFFVDDLDDRLLILLKQKGWEKCFIKKDFKALEYIGDGGKSIWPNTSFEEMKKLYEENPYKGKFAIRKFIEPEIIEKEERYWVLNGNIYHRHNKIPKVVEEAAKRLNKLGSKYYTIDATPEFIVEVNPGESSDRHAVNSAELFASWIKKEFVDR
jgi:hypothetical protein